MVRFTTFLVAASLASPSMAYSPSSNLNGRRAAMAKIASAGTTAGIAFFHNMEAASALEQCPDGSKNCVRTSWTPPAGTSQSDAISTLREVINAYPQEGQAEVDGGGWSIATDDLDGSSGFARVEYKSSGKGFFAKAFNGGKPFVDDLKLEVSDGGAVQVKSQSRVGESDFGVNGKRVDYLAAALKAKGWST